MSNMLVSPHHQQQHQQYYAETHNGAMVQGLPMGTSDGLPYRQQQQHHMMQHPQQNPYYSQQQQQYHYQQNGYHHQQQPMHDMYGNYSSGVPSLPTISQPTRPQQYYAQPSVSQASLAYSTTSSSDFSLPTIPQQRMYGYANTNQSRKEETPFYLPPQQPPMMETAAPPKQQSGYLYQMQKRQGKLRNTSSSDHPVAPSPSLPALSNTKTIPPPTLKKSTTTLAPIQKMATPTPNGKIPIPPSVPSENSSAANSPRRKRNGWWQTPKSRIEEQEKVKLLLRMNSVEKKDKNDSSGIKECLFMDNSEPEKDTGMERSRLRKPGWNKTNAVEQESKPVMRNRQSSSETFVASNSNSLQSLIPQQPMSLEPHPPAVPASMHSVQKPPSRGRKIHSQSTLAEPEFVEQVEECIEQEEPVKVTMRAQEQKPPTVEEKILEYHQYAPPKQYQQPIEQIPDETVQEQFRYDSKVDLNDSPRKSIPERLSQPKPRPVIKSSDSMRNMGVQADLENTVAVASNNEVKYWESRCQQLEVTNERLRNALRDIGQIEDEEATSQPNQQTLRIQKLLLQTFILSYLDQHGFRNSANNLGKELSMPFLGNNYKTLRSKIMVEKDFMGAIEFVKKVQRDSLEMIVELANCTTDKMVSAFDDLIYVLSKYAYINQLETHQFVQSQKTLRTYIQPHVDQELQKRGARAKWFAEDFALLASLLPNQLQHSTPHQSNPSKDLAPTPAMAHFLNDWDWKSELDLFWDAAANIWRKVLSYHPSRSSEPFVSAQSPLFSIALAYGFWDPFKSKHYDTFWKDLWLGNWRYTGVLELIAKSQASLSRGNSSVGLKSRAMSMIIDDTDTTEEMNAKEKNGVSRFDEVKKSQQHQQVQRQQPQAAAQKQHPQQQYQQQQQQHQQQQQFVEQPREEEPVPEPTPRMNKTSPSKPPREQMEYQPQPPITFKPPSNNRNPRPVAQPTFDYEASVTQATSMYTDTDRVSNSFMGYENTTALMPPLPREMETADFAFAKTCGPVLGSIRALDVMDIPETGEIVAATAGTDSTPQTSDRKISIWLLRTAASNTPSLYTQLDNGTYKSIMTLTFHPTRPEWLLTSDLDFDVKLWDWRKGVCLKTWKKLHSRIIHKVGVVPGCPERGVSCSGDQSIKFFWLDEPSQETGDDEMSGSPTKRKSAKDRERSIQSVHANEPFTSFTFCGDTQSQTLVATLSYSIRIYKMRTLSLLHTIHLKELKLNKTPITSIQSHPLYDNYVLLSCDNQLRLFDLSTETTLKVYMAREIVSGTRIEGLFSPCGTFIYTSNFDAKSFSSRHHRTPIEQQQQQQKSNNGKNGVFIWRLHTTKLEKAEMKAMMEYRGCGGTVVGCKWLDARDGTTEQKTKRKMMVTASLDKIIRVFF